jgi:transposase-like protein
LVRGETPGAESSPARGTRNPDTEVRPGKGRRRFSAAYKLKIVEAAERCRGKGEIGELLRREGLYSSHLTKWRQEALSGLTARQRGRKPVSVEQRRMVQLERENARLKHRLEQAEAIIAVQKKLSTLLGIALPTAATNDSYE